MTMTRRHTWDGAEVLAAVAPTSATRPAAELAALRLIRAGLRHPHETNEWGMARDVVQALGLIETVPRTPARDSVTRAMKAPAGQPHRSRRPCAGCTHGTSKHTVLGCTTAGCYCRSFVAPTPRTTTA